MVQSIKFLGMEIHILHDTANAKEGPINDLKQMLYRVDACPTDKTPEALLIIGQAGICPRQLWFLIMY